MWQGHSHRCKCQEAKYSGEININIASPCDVTIREVFLKQHHPVTIVTELLSHLSLKRKIMEINDGTRFKNLPRDARSDASISFSYLVIVTWVEISGPERGGNSGFIEIETGNLERGLSFMICSPSVMRGLKRRKQYHFIKELFQVIQNKKVNKSQYSTRQSAPNTSMDLGNFNFGFDDNYTMLPQMQHAETPVNPDRTMYLTAKFIAEYIFPLILFLGISGNLVGAVIMEKLSREVSSTCSYLGVCAIVDSVVLSISCGNGWLEKAIDKNVSYSLMVHSQIVCKVFPFIFNFLFHLSRWLLVAMTIEGFLATKYPSRAAHLCTLQRAKAVTLLLTVLLICINVHYFWSFEVMIDETNDSSECAFSRFNQQRSEGFKNIVWPLMDMLVGELAPNVIIVSCAVSMAVLTSKGLDKGPPSHQKWRQRYTIDPKAQDQLKVVFLYIGVLHVVFMLPGFVFIVVRFVNEKREASPNEVVLDLVGRICYLLQYIGSSSKVVVYFVMSPRFRREIRHRFQCCYKLCDLSEHRSSLFMKKSSSTTSNSRWRGMEDIHLESPIITRFSPGYHVSLRQT
ncbi:hypothetical protein CAPTEDRAFT_220557 [Capitella teleta]|uniref:G-protein coupled receptors family 1 profile domain-containing protein n=1 Tax=Capitella teleta TaxID=283909 RepID=R7TBJ0_CAPTE|nr:hypothetical protein CAPTEDRAFT_220557 [Capitella teleta]|eukprot:ELT88852.1 hypothetical protein CAPTEDRAFT_220557 [Capitella teleta]